MAIKNANGNYMRVVASQSNVPSSVHVELYQSEAKRQGGLSEFDNVVRNNIVCEDEFKDELLKKADSKESIQNNITIAAYRAIKRLNQFKDWTDC